MASPISTSTGIGSGLKITEIVTALVDADKAAKQKQITTQTAKNNASLSGVSQLKLALENFQATLKTLGDTTTPAFQGFSATSSNETAVKATADSTAVAGSYSIAVQKLATGSKVATVALTAGEASAIPSGELTISQNGTSTKVKIDSTSTLQQVRDEINKQMLGTGTTANIVNDANGSRLVFTSSNTGAGTDISVSGDANIGTLLDIDGTKKMSATGTPQNPGAGAISELAQDAEFTVDGLKLTSAKNTVSNAVSGLSLDLQSDAVGKTSTVVVAPNVSGMQKSAQSFVDSYNALVSLVSTLTKGTMSSTNQFTAAPMTGDSTPRNLLAAIRKEIATATSATGLNSLAQLGITTQQGDGTLRLDSAKFSAAVSDKKFGAQVQDLFTGSDGLVGRIGKAVDVFTKPDGILALKKSSLDKITTRLDNDKEALDRRVETMTATLTKKYNAMDLAVAQLKATASSITSIFEAMNAQKNAS